jgi:hypothetical protein
MVGVTFDNLSVLLQSFRKTGQLDLENPSDHVLDTYRFVTSGSAIQDIPVPDQLPPVPPLPPTSPKPPPGSVQANQKNTKSQKK